MCEVLGVSRSTVYRTLNRTASN
ncbi:hypothetical protein [Glutamicibacter arilaitensis]